jgi:hypothetical protein
MRLEEERDYWRDLVKDMADNMDFTAINYFLWKDCAKALFDVLSQYHDHHALPKDTVLYRDGLDALVKYEKLVNDNKLK